MKNRYTILNSISATAAWGLLLAAVLATSCGRHPSSDGGVSPDDMVVIEPHRYYNNALGFSMVVPPTWQVENTGVDSLLFANNGTNVFSVVVKTMPAEYTLENFLQDNTNTMAKSLQGYDCHATGQTSVAGQPAAWLKYSFLLEGEISRALAICAAWGRRVFTFTRDWDDAAAPVVPENLHKVLDTFQPAFRRVRTDGFYITKEWRKSHSRKYHEYLRFYDSGEVASASVVGVPEFDVVEFLNESRSKRRTAGKYFVHGSTVSFSIYLDGGRIDYEGSVSGMGVPTLILRSYSHITGHATTAQQFIHIPRQRR